MPLPSAVELEEVVIGALLLETKAMTMVEKILRPEMFYKKTHEHIYAAIADMNRAGREVDMLTVTEELKRRALLDEVGGPYEITRLVSRVASSAHIERHALIVKDKFLRRKLILGFSELQGRAQDETFDTSDVLASCHRMLDAVEGDCGWVQNVRGMDVLMHDAMEEARQRVLKSVNGLTGIPTGLDDLNEMTAGFQRQELIVIAGRPGTGKTSVAMHMMKAAARAGYRALVCSLEMSGERLADKWILSETRIEPTRWRNGKLAPEEMEQARQAAEGLSELKIKVDDSAKMSMDYIRSEARLQKSKYGLDIICIDYLQLADMDTGKSSRNREQEVAQAAHQAKLLAKEMDCPVVLLCQLNRESESRPGKVPQMSDLRESGSIEQDADIVGLLYRPALANILIDRESRYPTKNLGIIIIAKQRNGATGKVYFNHDESMTRISDKIPLNSLSGEEAEFPF